MKKTFFIVIALVAAAVILMSACMDSSGAPTASTELKGPSVSLSAGTPYSSAGPSSTVTISITPLPMGTESTQPSPPAETAVPEAS